MSGKRTFKIHWAWVVLGSSIMTLFVTYSIRIGAYSVLLPEMIKDFRITKAEAGMIKSAFSMTYLLFAPLMGWLTDRIGGRKVISLFCLLLGGGTSLMGTAQDLPISAIYYSVVGIGAAGTWVPIVTLIQNWFGEKKRGLALGILSPNYGIGFGLMGVILPGVVVEYHWRLGWFSLGTAGLLLTVLNGMLLRDHPGKMALSPWGESGGEVTDKMTPPSQRIGYFEILRRGRFWMIGHSIYYGCRKSCSTPDGWTGVVWIPVRSDLAHVRSLRKRLFPEGSYRSRLWIDDHFLRGGRHDQSSFDRPSG